MRLTKKQQEALSALPSDGTTTISRAIGVSPTTLVRLARMGLVWTKYYDGVRYYGLTELGQTARAENGSTGA